MSTVFTSLKQLQRYLEVQIEDTVRTDVKDEVSKMLEKSGLENVYDVYEPKVYMRRHGDGDSLLDPDNFNGEVNGNELTITSSAMPNYNYNGEYDSTVKSLAELVEYGHGYKGQYYSYPFSAMGPRPFIEPTRDELAQGDTLKNIIKKGLIRHGLTVE